MVSLPAPPSMMSLPEPPAIVSSSSPPLISTAMFLLDVFLILAPTVMVSSPASPLMTMPVTSLKRVSAPMPGPLTTTSPNAPPATTVIASFPVVPSMVSCPSRMVAERSVRDSIGSSLGPKIDSRKVDRSRRRLFRFEDDEGFFTLIAP